MSSNKKALHSLSETVEPGHGYYRCDNHPVGCDDPYPTQGTMRLRPRGLQYLHRKNRETGTGIQQQAQHDRAVIRATNHRSQQEQIALPVQAVASTGTRPALYFPSNIASASDTIRCGSQPTIVLVPRVTVTGRSVFSRSVRQGTPRIVVSS